MLGTNLGLAALVAALIYFGGAGPFLMVHLPIMLLAASIGVWLFYVQHQFEGAFWARKEDWTLHEASGATLEAELLDSSLVHPALLVLNFRIRDDGVRSRALLGDELEPEMFRRLRARLALKGR